MEGKDKIVIKGAREHNLKNIDVEIPKNKLVVFTGVSGSGKSSLAFDTIYAEGQRRYVESLSAYARQFLGIMNKPDVDTIDGLSPAISIEQKSASHNPRSTVGTVTEIYDYLRLLFARIGHPHCPVCGREIAQQGADQITTHILQLIKEMVKVRRFARLMTLSPVVRDRKGEFTNLLESLRTQGYSWARIDGRIYPLSEELVLIKTNKHSVDVVIDKISVERKQIKDKVGEANIRSRLYESVEQALRLSDGLVVAAEVNDKGFSFPEMPKELTDHLYSERFSCPVDNISFPEIEPRMFSFNSPHGACPTCKGLGALMKGDPGRVLNPNLSIQEGGILPFSSVFEHDTWFARTIKTFAEENKINTSAPIRELDEKQKNLLLYGTGDRVYEVRGANRFGRMTKIYETFPGIINELERRHSQTESDFIRSDIDRFMVERVCPECEGARLKKESLAITIAGQSIVDVAKMTVTKAFSLTEKLLAANTPLAKREYEIGRLVLKEIASRLSFLNSVGLEYLTLDRSANTLSGGEAQRIRLASQVGSGLTGVLYVLDEPTIGLHPRDGKRLIETLKKLRDLGNTVIVVEHDREMMQNADLILDFGPGAGKHGGIIIAQGDISDICKNVNSRTGAYLSGKKTLWFTKNEKVDEKRILTIKGASKFNLKNLTVDIPLGRLVCITGVSGSGKSTLLVETLYPALKSALGSTDFYDTQNDTRHKTLVGAENIKRVSLIDQSPIGRTPRSNPATYTGVFGDIRGLFAQSPDARVRGYKPGRFSFNVKGGRCEACEGQGVNKIEMQFLPDVYIECEVCKGRRYNHETLEVAWHGKDIADVLAMTVEEAREFFANIPAIADKLGTLSDVGLNYMELGQSAPTLSGGEAQRVKLAAELGRRSGGNTFYILDEPTTGLHFADIEKLLFCLRRLADIGNTVVIIEHNLDVIKNSDWIIDLGPEGGEKGGEIVAEGAPHDVAKNRNSYTGQHLAQILR
ncbi:MAG: excinuclease ABC subunit UvrA [Candidatus Blackburnbacteria bacterium]|nr:excinuclease ABC subunit UvrA [Candidatus Blackburnbacteria bacterium]